MSDSNGAWGRLAEHDTTMAGVWDGYARLPDPGENAALDALCERKRITINALVRLGAKLAEPTVLAFAYEGGIKFRDMVTGRRWSYVDSSWDKLLFIRAEQPSTTCIVAEGETDGARLAMLYPDVDVAVMGGGAKYVPESFIEQTADYELVLVALDADEAGEAGAAKWAEHAANAMRFAPPANDWCATPDEEVPRLPSELERQPEPIMLVSAGDLFELDKIGRAHV